jgi:competence protein ComGC
MLMVMLVMGIIMFIYLRDSINKNEKLNNDRYEEIMKMGRSISDSQLELKKRIKFVLNISDDE